MNNSVVGLDIAKNIFHCYSLGSDGKVTAYVGVSLKRTPTFFIICLFVGIRTSSQPTTITSQSNDNTQLPPQRRYLL
jgi:hypothetical protein